MDNPDSRSGARNFLRPHLITALLLIATGLLIYSGIFQVPFVLDDISNIRNNPHIRMTDLSGSSLVESLRSRSTNRPLANLSFALNYFFHQYRVPGYHAVNLAVHIITAFLVFVVGRQTLLLCGRSGLAAPLFAALLWLVNPVHTQSVTYIVQRMNSLAALFCLLALACYVQARLLQIRGNRPKTSAALLAGVILSWLLALSAKEIAVTLPVFLFLYEWYFFRDLDRSWLKKQLPRLAGLALAVAAIALVYMGGDPAGKLGDMYDKQDFTPGQRLLTQPLVVLYYLTLLAFPHPDRLILVYDFPLSHGLTAPAVTPVALAALTLLGVAAVTTAAKHRLASFALLWFLGCLAVESSFVGLALIFEHRTYLPSVFLFIALAAFLFPGPTPSRAVIAAAVAAVLFSGLGTYHRNRLWQDDIALWRDNIAKAPAAALPWVNLGNIHLEQGRPEEALTYFENSLRLEPKNIRSRHNLAVALAETGEQEKAAAIFEEILAINPEVTETHYQLAKYHLRAGRTDRAVEYLRRSIAINPYLAKVHNDLGGALLLRGNVREAAAAFEEAIRLDPGFKSPHLNLAVVHRQAEPRTALAHLAAVLAIDPDDRQALTTSGEILEQLGETGPAIAYYEQAAALASDDPRPLLRLGFLYARDERYPEAISAFQRLGVMYPDNPTIFYNLACLHSLQNDREQALEFLEQAVELGYDNRKRIRTAPDLDNIRHTEGYRRLVDRMENRDGAPPR